MFQKLTFLLTIIIVLNFKNCSIFNKYYEAKEDEIKIEENKVSFQEYASQLESLGITGITNEQIEVMENMYKDMPEEIREDMDMYPLFLSQIGFGTYNYDTWEWTPSSEFIYSFDTEVFNCSMMYTDFLTGIKAISNNEFIISEVVEEVSEEDFEKGTGKQTVHFKYNETPYTFEAKLMYDWFDVDMLKFMNQVFEKEGNPKRLYCMGDGGQSCIVFYCTKEWAEQFKVTTGYILECVTY